MKIGEEGYKIQSKRCLFFKNTNVKIKKGRKIDSPGHSTEETQRQTLKNVIVKVFLAKRWLALCCQGQRAL
jgi:hypothetical protein